MGLAAPQDDHPCVLRGPGTIFPAPAPGPHPASRVSRGQVHDPCGQVIITGAVQQEVQQHARAAASLSGHLHPPRAGMAAKRAAAPLVRDEEAVPAACPIGRSTPGNYGHSRTARYTGSSVTASATRRRVRLVVAGAGRSPDGGGPGSTVAGGNARGCPGGRRRAEVGWIASTGRRGWPSRRCPWHLRVRRGRGHIRRGSAGPHDLGGKRGPGYVRRHIPGCAIRAPGGSVRRPGDRRPACHGDSSVLRGNASEAHRLPAVRRAMAPDLRAVGRVDRS